MPTLHLLGDDPGLLERWTQTLVGQGHAYRLVDPTERRFGASDDLFLLDLGQRGEPDLSSTLGQIQRNPQLRCMIFAARPQPDQGLALLQAGARAYCNRQVSPAVLGAIIDAVMAGEIWAGREVTDFLLNAALQRPAVAPPAASALLDALTARESEIALLVADGSSNKVIAAGLSLSERTVKAHLNSIFRKTGLHNRVQLALALVGDEPAALRDRSA